MSSPSSSVSGGKNRSSASTVKIADLAQVVQRGRNINLMIGEEAHIKPVLSAIQAMGLPTPAPLPNQKLQFSVPIPPPTAESRKEAASEADKFEGVSATNLRNARGDCKKRLAKLAKDNEVLPDELREMEAKMEIFVKNGASEMKSMVESAKKAIMSQ